MRDAGWGPALLRPLRACGTANHRGAGLPGVSRALPARRACTTADRTGVPEGVLRFKRDRRPLLLARSFSTLWSVSWRPPRLSPPTTVDELRGWFELHAPNSPAD